MFFVASCFLLLAAGVFFQRDVGSSFLPFTITSPLRPPLRGYLLLSPLLCFFSGNCYLCASKKVKKAKNNASIGNTGHFDEVTDLAFSEGSEGMKIENIMHQKIVSSYPLAG